MASSASPLPPESQVYAQLHTKRYAESSYTAEGKAVRKGSMTTRLQLAGMPADSRFYVAVKTNRCWYSGLEKVASKATGIQWHVKIKVQTSESEGIKLVDVNINSLAKRLHLTPVKIIEASKKEGGLESLIQTEGETRSEVLDSYKELIEHYNPELKQTQQETQNIAHEKLNKVLTFYEGAFTRFESKLSPKMAFHRHLMQEQLKNEAQVQLAEDEMSGKTGLTTNKLMTIVKLAHTSKMGGVYDIREPSKQHTYLYGVDMQGRAKIAVEHTKKLLGQGTYGIVHSLSVVGQEKPAVAKEATSDPKFRNRAIEDIQNEAVMLREISEKARNNDPSKTNVRGIMHAPDIVVDLGSGAVGYVGTQYTEDLQKHFSRLTSKQEVTRASGDLIEGLAFMHECGIVHGDIKPENCMYHGETGECKIGDFGGARHKEGLAGEIRKHGLVTTPIFVAPMDRRIIKEIQSGPSSLTDEQVPQFVEALDVYATGASLIAMALPGSHFDDYSGKLFYEGQVILGDFAGGGALDPGMNIDQRAELAAALSRKGYDENYINLIYAMVSPNWTERPSSKLCCEYIRAYEANTSLPSLQPPSAASLSAPSGSPKPAAEVKPPSLKMTDRVSWGVSADAAAKILLDKAEIGGYLITKEADQSDGCFSLHIKTDQGETETYLLAETKEGQEMYGPISGARSGLPIQCYKMKEFDKSLVELFGDQCHPHRVKSPAISLH